MFPHSSMPASEQGNFYRKQLQKFTGRRQKEFRESNCTTVRSLQNPCEKSKHNQTKGPSGSKQQYVQAKTTMTLATFLLHTCTSLERIAGTATVKTRSFVNHIFWKRWNQPQDLCGTATDFFISTKHTAEVRYYETCKDLHFLLLIP